MVKLIFGKKGIGKTKTLIDLANTASETDKGCVVFVEYDCKVREDVVHSVRLINIEEYEVKSYQLLRGFLTGLYAGNYDIDNIFLDSLTKLSGNESQEDCARFLRWCERFGEANGVNFTATITLPAEASDELKRYA